MFIPEITTRVHVEMDTSELDAAISVAESEDLISQMGIADILKEEKEKLTGLKDPLAEAVANGLRDRQKVIIDSKHHITGMMADVDIMQDGEDYLVGSTASSVDGFPYPLAIEKGTKAHWVEPVTFSALHWIDKSSGKDMFSKGHMVPGISPDPFVDPSINDTIQDIEDIWNGLKGGD